MSYPPFSPFKAPIHDNLWQTYFPSFGNEAGAYTTGPFTMGTNFSLETEYSAVQLILANCSTNAQTIGGVICAPSAQNTSYTEPLDMNGNEIAFTPVTFNGGSTTVTLPAATASTVSGNPGPIWSLTLSDTIPLESLKRTDGGKFPLLYTRTLSPASGQAINQFGYYPGTFIQATNSYNTASGGRNFQTWLLSGDYTESQYTPNVNDLYVGSGIAYGFMYVVGVRFVSKRKCITIATVGDSLTVGAGTSGYISGYGMVASNLLSSDNCAVSFVQQGYGGTVMSDIAARAAICINTIKPNILCIPISSPNNYNPGYGTNPAWRGQAQEVLKVIDLAIQNNVQPILLTPIPFGSDNGLGIYPTDKITAGTYARNLFNGSFPVLDAQTLLCGANSTTMTLPSKYQWVDGDHVNTAGHALLGSALADLVRSII